MILYLFQKQIKTCFSWDSEGFMLSLWISLNNFLQILQTKDIDWRNILNCCLKATSICTLLGYKKYLDLLRRRAKCAWFFFFFFGSQLMFSWCNQWLRRFQLQGLHDWQPFKKNCDALHNNLPLTFKQPGTWKGVWSSACVEQGKRS